MIEDLKSLFGRYFEIHCNVGSNPKLLGEALGLRFQVYCIEHAYEEPSEFPDQMERDRYDERSYQSLLIHRPTGLAAGTVRLIRPNLDKPIGSLPIDTLCDQPELFDETLLPRDTIAEVSRFAVSKAFRRRLEDAPTPTGIGPNWREPEQKEELRKVPHLSLGLVQAMVCTSAQQGLTHWVAEMEPALLRMYARLGVHWIKLGPTIEFHGKRQPCYTKLDNMLQRTLKERADIWDMVTDGGRCVPPDTFSEVQ